MAHNRENQENKMNLNEASREELQQSIKGVGVNVAQDIVNYRQENGRIERFEELRNIGGIDDEMQAKIEESTCL